MAKNLANYLGLKLIKPLPFQVLTQLPVGGLFFFPFPAAHICFLSLQFWILSAFPYRSWMMHWTALNLVFPGDPLPHASPPCLVEPVLRLKCISVPCNSQSIANHKAVLTCPEMTGECSGLFPRCPVQDHHAWNANLTSLLCIYSDPWRNAVMKSVHTWC